MAVGSGETRDDAEGTVVSQWNPSCASCRGGIGWLGKFLEQGTLFFGAKVRDGPWFSLNLCQCWNEVMLKPWFIPREVIIHMPREECCPCFPVFFKTLFRIQEASWHQNTSKHHGLPWLSTNLIDVPGSRKSFFGLAFDHFRGLLAERHEMKISFCAESALKRGSFWKLVKNLLLRASSSSSCCCCCCCCCCYFFSTCNFSPDLLLKAKSCQLFCKTVYVWCIYIVFYIHLFIWTSHICFWCETVWINVWVVGKVGGFTIRYELMINQMIDWNRKL